MGFFDRRQTNTVLEPNSVRLTKTATADIKTISLFNGMTIRDVLNAAEWNLNSSKGEGVQMSVVPSGSSSNVGETISLDALAEEGATYVIVANVNSN